MRAGDGDWRPGFSEGEDCNVCMDSPGHAGVRGNEMAEGLTSRAAITRTLIIGISDAL